MRTFGEPSGNFGHTEIETATTPKQLTGRLYTDLGLEWKFCNIYVLARVLWLNKFVWPRDMKSEVLILLEKSNSIRVPFWPWRGNTNK